MKKQKVLKSTIIILIILLIPQALLARGAMYQEQKYEEQLQQATEQICSALEAKEMNATQAKSTLSELRERFQKEYTDESGRMDALIDAVANGEMTAEQAREGFLLMQQDRLAERDRLQQQQQQLKEQQDEPQQQQQEQSDRDKAKSQDRESNKDNSSDKESKKK